MLGFKQRSSKLIYSIGSFLIAFLIVQFLLQFGLDALLQEDAQSQQQVSTPSDIHSSNQAIVDLLDWEIESMDTNQDCKPPNGISELCCIGTFSRGGDLWGSLLQRRSCFTNGVDPYGRVLELLAAELDEHPTSTDLACDVCQIMNLAQQFNLTISFLGDSVTLQVYQGFLCELQRRNYIVTELHTPKIQDCGYYCVKLALSNSVSSPVNASLAITTRFFLSYKFPVNDTDAIFSDANILVTNYGLHWLEPAMEKYEASMMELFAAVRRYPSIQLVTFRETTAQHFDWPGGNYEEGNFKFDSKHCVALRRAPNCGFREPHLINAATRAGYQVVAPGDALSDMPQVVILPYYEFTAQLHDLHLIGNIEKKRSKWRGECTHFCSNPFVWAPQWRYLRLAMESRFLQKS